MNVVTSHAQHEHLGPVVPVDDERLRSSSSVTLQVPGGRRPSSSGPVSPVLGGSEHKLLGHNDEHHILTTPGGQLAAQKAALKSKPNISSVMNEYVGACFEDNCNIGEQRAFFFCIKNKPASVGGLAFHQHMPRRS